jgi:hypothetical protein
VLEWGRPGRLLPESSRSGHTRRRGWFRGDEQWAVVALTGGHGAVGAAAAGMPTRPGLGEGRACVGARWVGRRTATRGNEPSSGPGEKLGWAWLEGAGPFFSSFSISSFSCSFLLFPDQIYMREREKKKRFP